MPTPTKPTTCCTRSSLASTTPTAAEAYPTDTRFFDQIAGAVAGTGRIVLVSHGTGQSNEADHLMAWLLDHHDAVHARVTRSIVADLPHLTVGELLQLARHAMPPAQKSAVMARATLSH